MKYLKKRERNSSLDKRNESVSTRGKKTLPPQNPRHLPPPYKP